MDPETLRLKALARAKAWYRKNLVRRKVYAASWEERNKAKRRLQQRAWRARVREKTSECEYASCHKPKGWHKIKFCVGHSRWFDHRRRRRRGGKWRRTVIAASSSSSTTPLRT